jgi:hypothetical protein
VDAKRQKNDISKTSGQWTPHSLLKAIEQIKEMLNDTDAVRDAKDKKASEVTAMCLICEVEEKYPEFYEFIPSWLREKDGSGHENKIKLLEKKIQDLEAEKPNKVALEIIRVFCKEQFPKFYKNNFSALSRMLETFYQKNREEASKDISSSSFDKIAKSIRELQSKK